MLILSKHGQWAKAVLTSALLIQQMLTKAILKFLLCWRISFQENRPYGNNLFFSFFFILPPPFPYDCVPFRFFPFHSFPRFFSFLTTFHFFYFFFHPFFATYVLVDEINGINICSIPFVGPRKQTNDRFPLLRQLNTSSRIPHDVYFFIHIFNTQREWKDCWEISITKKIWKSFLVAVLSS